MNGMSWIRLMWTDREVPEVGCEKGRTDRSMHGRLLQGLLLLGFLVGAGCSDPDKAIIAGFDSAQEAQFRRGRSIAVPCWTCHDLAGTVKKNGPSLLGIHGRRSGMAPGYNASPALLGASIVWDDRSLRAFLANPSRFIPGNGMVSPGIQDASALSDLLFYLRHVTRPGARD